jgi:prevent-host-death family protein
LTKLVIGARLPHMKQVNVAEAKAQLPKLIELAAKGEVIVVARAGKPRAKIVGLGPDDLKLRKPGKGKGRFRMKKDFDAPLPAELIERFEGKKRK